MKSVTTTIITEATFSDDMKAVISIKLMKAIFQHISEEK